MKSLEHSFHVPLPTSTTFALFTPKGEESWVPDWRPTYIQPPSGDTQVDMIFCTGRGEEATIWTCLAYDDRRRRVRYLRVTPASRVAFVSVACDAAPGGTLVRVGYRYVPLNDSGVAYVHAMDQEAFGTMVETWRSLIGQNVLQEPGSTFHPD